MASPQHDSRHDSRKRARPDHLSQELDRPKHKRHRTSSDWPPHLWDKLSKVPLVRRSLRELDRRNRTAAQLEAASRTRTRTPPATSNLGRFARHGGPDLCHLRSYPKPGGVVHTMSRPSARSTATGTRKTSAYDAAFEQLMIDYSVYPRDYFRAKDVDAGISSPNNLEHELEILGKRRPSLDSSHFTESEFETFIRDNRAATNEGTLTRTVIYPFLVGSSGSDIYNSGENLFSNIEPFAEDRVVKPKPDFFDGAHISAIDRRIRDTYEDGNLNKLIIPTNHALVLPNFFLEVKGVKGSATVARRQAMHVGAVGARGMHALQNYGKDEPVYDGNAYTYTSTYSEGVLELYAHHIAPPTVPGGQPEYYMTTVDSWLLTSRRHSFQSFREGVAAFRNARDRAREFRDNFIEAANARARALQSDGGAAAPPHQATGSTAAAGVTAQSGEATAGTTAAAGATEQRDMDESTAGHLGGARGDDAGSESSITSTGAEDYYTVSQAVVDGEASHPQQLLHDQEEEHEPPNSSSHQRAIEPATGTGTTSFAATSSRSSSLKRSQVGNGTNGTSGSSKGKRTRFAEFLSSLNAGKNNHDKENKRLRRGSF
ncbi:hypothetical protein B0T20DRAFT_242149 [Sordaria brevicollis]|uniref:DUF7924 domain-containing protein n=1 Tax=Sordaria brevicollis TaxID=83679 RepID=A0AAE0PBC0_SORBR|nr:hypothetical protein B0T20DRAFT_242149 [Sordaria brevicollis]